MRTKNLLAAAAALAVLCALPANAGERPLIWEVSKISDASYAARLGSRLPTPIESRVGGVLRLRGPDPRSFSNPVALWATVQLAERHKRGDIRSTSLEAFIDGVEGNRRLALNNHLTFNMPSFDAELRQELAIDYQPQGDRLPHVHQRQGIRILSQRLGTEFRAATTRRDRERWFSTISIRQPVADGVEISASLEKSRSTERKARLRATYRYRW